MAVKEFLINGNKIAIELLEQHPAYFKFKINDKTFEISLEKYDTKEQLLNLIINNKPVKIKSIKQQDIGGDNLLLYIVNYCSQVLVEPIKKDSRPAAYANQSVETTQSVGWGSNNGYEIKSPLAGRIVKILVKPGDQIQKNQPLLIIESMKMENEIRATSAGIIKNISIEVGNLVQQNQVLIILE